MKIKRLHASVVLVRDRGTVSAAPCHTVRVTGEMNLEVAAGLFLDLAAG